MSWGWVSNMSPRRGGSCFVQGTERKLGEVNLQNGALIVSETMDRGELCGRTGSCQMKFELVIENPLSYTIVGWQSWLQMTARADFSRVEKYRSQELRQQCLARCSHQSPLTIRMLGILLWPLTNLGEASICFKSTYVS